MDKNEILAKSRAENKNQDVYEQEIIKQASQKAVLVQSIIATIFLLIQILLDKGINWGLYAIVLSGTMTANWMTYIRLRRKSDLKYAIAYTVLVLIMSAYHIYNLIFTNIS